METLTHKCPNCGGPLLFDPKDQTFHCEYCLSIYTEEEVSDYEKNQKDAQLENETINSTIEDFSTTDEKIELFLCPSCGAEIATDATTAATYCYYCHNPVVLSGRLSGQFLPEKVLPFTIEKEEAIDKFLSWTKKKWFIPRNFFDKNQIEKLTGVYFPYWTVDANLSGELNAKGTSIRIWRMGDIEYTETKQFDVERTGKLSFKELIKNALSKNTQQKIVEGVQPFLLDKAVPFKSQYLAGFQAEKRDIEYMELKESIKNELKDYSEALLRDSASGYTSLTNVRTSVSIEEEQNHYMLLPIWLVTYKSSNQSDKIYYYAMNGQTGKVSGVLPISYKRLGLFTAGLFILLLLLFLLGGYFL